MILSNEPLTITGQDAGIISVFMVARHVMLGDHPLVNLHGMTFMVVGQPPATTLVHIEIDHRSARVIPCEHVERITATLTEYVGP